MKKTKGMKGGKKRIKPRLWSLKKADDEFSLFIRERDGKCKRCGKLKSPDNPLTCSHFWGRQHKGTRFDPENNDAACWMPCHKYYWEKEKQGDYRDFKIKQLGKKKYDAMEKRARGIYSQDRAIMDCMTLLGAL
jgi:hypothetical protein